MNRAALHNKLIVVAALAVVLGGIFIIHAYTGTQSMTTLPKLLIVSGLIVGSIFCYQGAQHE